jgi:hypothetical protein
MPPDSSSCVHLLLVRLSFEKEIGKAALFLLLSFTQCSLLLDQGWGES